MSSIESQHLRIAVAGSDALKRVIADAIAQSPRDLEVVANTETAHAALDACQTQGVDILVLHTQALSPHSARSAGELKPRYPKTRFLLSFGLIADDEILSVIAAGVDGLVAESCDAAEFAVALDRLAAGMNYFCARSSSVLARAARGQPLTPEFNKSHLTRREKEVVLLVAAGRKNKEIARLLNLSCATVDTHRRNLMSKLGTHNAADLVRYCYSQGWIC